MVGGGLWPPTSRRPSLLERDHFLRHRFKVVWGSSNGSRGRQWGGLENQGDLRRAREDPSFAVPGSLGLLALPLAFGRPCKDP